MDPNFCGLNEDDDLDELFDANSPIVPSEYVYRNSKNAAITNNSSESNTYGRNGGATDSQFSNLLQESLNENLMDCHNSNESTLVMESQSDTASTRSQSFESFSNLSFHSLLRRNIIDQALTMVQHHEDARSVPTQDNPVFSPFFGKTQQNENVRSVPTQDNPVFSPFFGKTQQNEDVRSVPTQDPVFSSLFGDTQQNEDLCSLPTQDNSVFFPFFGDTQSSFPTSINEGRQYYQNSQTNVIEPIDIDHQSQDSHDRHSLFTLKQPSHFHLSLQRQSNLQQNFPSIMSPLNIFGSYQPPEHIAANVSSIPKSILNLYKQIKESGLSDWAFIHALSAQTCQEFTPMDCYTMLKTSLLLSIASINEKSDRVPIPIIALGKDCSSADSIMNHIGNFAQRFLAPTDQIFNVSMNLDKFVEIGPVFLAKNGVCYLGNWSGLTKSVSEEIQIIIGSGRFFLDKSSENFKLGSAIWTHGSYTENIRKDRMNVAMFLKYFGIPIVMDTDRSDVMIEFILEESMNGHVEIPKDALDICYEDMKTYLNIIRKIEVKTSKSAQILLKSYSDAIKLDREDALSPRGSEIIQQMTESYAKMCLRDTVLDCDVIAVIAILEKTIRGLIGVSRVVSSAPILHNVRCIEEVDDYMKKFEKWIYDYLRMFKQSQT